MTNTQFTKPKFNFREIVKVTVQQYDDVPIGSKGYIASMDAEPQPANGYGVFLFDLDEVWEFDESDLESTHEFVPKGFNKSGESIKVLVNEKGEGFLKE